MKIIRYLRKGDSFYTIRITRASTIGIGRCILH